jgi:hypothetical protein
MTKLKEIDLDDIDFENNSSQQFATVIFDRREDANQALITIIKDKMINQFEGDNRYNPSERRGSTCVYAQEEWEDGSVIKICTIQHKGSTLVEVHSVSDDEMAYLFRNAKR